MDRTGKKEYYEDRKNETHDENYQEYYRKRREYRKDNNKDSKELLAIIRKAVDEKDIDEEEQDDYYSYPDYSDPNFNTKVFKKAEFHYCKGLLDLISLENKCFSTNFELGNHQHFLKNFINKNTPYKGILIFHGVGVGKTCSAVTISSSFIDLYKKEEKKIICLVSKNIQPNWMNTIYDPEKGENQCNGENFQNIIRNIDSKINTSGRVKKLIKEYYEFYGYQQFSNMVKKKISIK